jgi:hypothetical protein
MLEILVMLSIKDAVHRHGSGRKWYQPIYFHERVNRGEILSESGRPSDCESLSKTLHHLARWFTRIVVRAQGCIIRLVFQLSKMNKDLILLSEHPYGAVHFFCPHLAIA